MGSNLFRKVMGTDYEHGIVVLCDQAIVSLTNFATAVIVGRACGKTELGAYTLAWSVITIVSGISSRLTSTPYMVYGPQLSRSQRSSYLTSVCLHQLLCSTVSASFIAIGVLLLSSNRVISGDIEKIMMTTAAVIVSITLREFIRSISFADMTPRWALCVDLVASLGQMTGIVLLLKHGTLAAFHVLMMLGISSAVAVVLWASCHKTVLRLEWTRCFRDLRVSWKLGKWVLGSGLLWQLANYLYPWMIAAFHGTSVTGVWAACCGVVAIGNPIWMGLGNYLLPRVSSVYAISGVTAMRRYVRRSSILLAVSLLPFVIMLTVYGERSVERIYGGAYSGTGVIVAILALNLVVASLATPYAQALFTLENASADTLSNVVGVSVLFAMGILAVRSHAAVGAAATMLASSSIGVVIRMGAFARSTHRHMTSTSGLTGAHTRIAITASNP